MEANKMETNNEDRKLNQEQVRLRNTINCIKDALINSLTDYDESKCMDHNRLEYILRIAKKEAYSILDQRDSDLSFFAPEEMHRLMEEADTISPTHGLLIRILSQTGITIVELVMLDLIDIQKNDLCLLIKSRYNYREIPISQDLMDRITKYTSGRSAGPIFINSIINPNNKHKIGGPTIQTRGPTLQVAGCSGST